MTAGAALSREARRGLLTSRATGRAGEGPNASGISALGLGGNRDAVLYVPRSYEPGQPAPLLLLLHGAGGEGRHLVDLFTETAEARGYLILSPDSRGRTWDVILGGFGADVAFIDSALGLMFERFAVDPRRLAVGGFSDGASYALSLGFGNGELFRHILAFSPGFTAPVEANGSPRIFVSHGVGDRVLPIDSCSRRLVPAFQRAGYDVDYREFDGGHVVPPEMVTAAVARFLTAI
jgi:phospholipase/carboxylesterase